MLISNRAAASASGHTRVALTVGGWTELVPWMLCRGPEAKVIGPAALRGHAAGQLRGGAALYRRAEGEEQ